MNKKNYNKFYYFLTLLFSIMALETFFTVAYNLTNSKYFESYHETMERYDRNLVEKKKNFLNELYDDKKIKIAIFGESSAAGYASPLSFADFIQKIDKNIIIHNFSEPGSPFTYYQSEILKKFVNNYNYIIIYAGHNEIWSYLTTKNFKKKTDLNFPSKNIDYNDDLKNRLNYINELIEIKKNFFTYKKIIFFSRIANFSRRVFVSLTKIKIRIIQGEFENKPDIRYPLYTSDPILKNEEKKIIINNFSNKIDSIEKLLLPGQKLIISTVFANDLFPPITDFIDNYKTEDKVKDQTKNLKEIYNSIFSDNPTTIFLESVTNSNYENNKLLENKIKSIPNSAHRYYLSGIHCIRKKFIDNEADNQECFELLRKSRSFDYMPLRILPEVNSVIRLKENYNIKIIDPERKLNLTNNLYEYLSFFVDFQHPSSYGHSIIAEELAKIIFNDKNIFIRKINNCDQYEIRHNNIINHISAEKGIIKNKIDINNEWLINFKESSEINFLYSYYLKKNLLKLSQCNF